MTQTKAISCKRVHVDELPRDGVYPGRWGGYTVTFRAAGLEYEARTVDGIRTPSAPAKVTVSGSQIYVETIPKVREPERG